jgi:hypothetical protein
MNFKISSDKGSSFSSLKLTKYLLCSTHGNNFGLSSICSPAEETSVIPINNVWNNAYFSLTNVIRMISYALELPKYMMDTVD